METQSNDAQENKIKYLPNLILKTDEKPKPDRVLHERYWTSWEEEKLIELWCKYQDQVTELDDKYPIFRVIADDMKEVGFQLTTRECRRRMATLKNKYFTEKRRIETGGSKIKCTWRLFPLLECFLEPQEVMSNVLHVYEILDELFAELKKENPSYLDEKSVDKQTDDLFKLALAKKHSTVSLTVSRTIPKPTVHRHSKYSIMPIRRVTPLLLHELRCDIIRVQQKRDNDLKRLRLEQNDYYFWVALFEQSEKELEAILHRVQKKNRGM